MKILYGILILLLLLPFTSAWWDTAYSYKKPIQISGDASEILYNVSIYVNVTYSSKMQTNFNDIRFTDGTETLPLYYEVDNKVDSNYAAFWVNVPVLNTEELSNTIYMYYGNAAATNGENASMVWNKADVVYHFTEGAGSTIKDSVRSNNLTCSNVKWNTGVFGNEIQSQTNQCNSTLNLTIQQAQNRTFLMWNQWNTIGVATGFSFAYGNPGGAYTTYRVGQTSSLWYLEYQGFNINFAQPDTSLAFVTNVYNGTTDWFNVINGSGNLSGGIQANSLKTNFSKLYVGASQTAQYLNGTVDELRVYNETKTQAWLNRVYQTTNFSKILMGGETSLPFIVTWVNYTYPIYELSTDNFRINVTYNSNITSDISAQLFYNNTFYPTTRTLSLDKANFVTTLAIPNVDTATNISFLWAFAVTNVTGTFYINSSTYKQQINNLAFDDCSVYTNRIINMTFYDEDTRSELVPPGTNTSLEVAILIGNPTMTESNYLSYNKTNIKSAYVCLENALTSTSIFRLDGTIKYNAGDKVLEYYNLQNETLNNTNFPKNISLYDLNITQSQDFLISVTDENLNYVPDALVVIKRQYVSLLGGAFVTVEVPKTDGQGQTIGHFVLNDIVYTIEIWKNGQLLAIFEDRRAFCSNIATGDCQIALRLPGVGARNQGYNSNVGTDIFLNTTTRVVSTTYQTRDGLSHIIILNVTEFNSYMNNSLCLQTTSGFSGSLSCVIPSSFGNGTILIQVLGDGSVINQAITTLNPIKQTVTILAIFAAIMIFVSIVLIGMAAGPTLAILSAIVGLVGITLLNIVYLGSPIGPTSAIIWFIIAGGVLLWKVVQK